MGRKRDYIIGKDIQVAVMNNEWVKSMHHPGCTYSYMGDGERSYLVTRSFNCNGENGLPHRTETFDEIERIGGWEKILKEQEKFAAEPVQS